MLVLSLPAVYSLELTSVCNNHCPGCYNPEASQGVRHAGHWLPAADWIALLEQIGPEAARIRLTGGEPTLHPEFERIFRAACAYDAEVTLFTNARWREPEKTLTVLRGAKRLSGLLVSVHGAQAETHEAFTRVPGSFHETLANIRRARERGIAVAFSTVITRANFAELEKIVALGDQLGVEYIAFNRNLGPTALDDPHGKTVLLAAVRRIESLIRQGKHISYGTCIPQCLRTNSSDGCMAGVTQAAIDPLGSLRPCVYSLRSFGSVFETPIAEIWRGQAMQAWRAAELEACAACAAYPVCHSGCPAARERFPQDPLQGQPRRRFTVHRAVLPLPEHGRPIHHLRVRREDFGYSLIGEGQVWPVSAEGLEVLRACSGDQTVSQLRARFGPAVDFIQELWNAGLVRLAGA